MAAGSGDLGESLPNRINHVSLIPRLAYGHHQILSLKSCGDQPSSWKRKGPIGTPTKEPRRDQRDDHCRSKPLRLLGASQAKELAIHGMVALRVKNNGNV